MVQRRLLVEEDVDGVVASCVARFDAAVSGEWYPPVLAPGNVATASTELPKL